MSPDDSIDAMVRDAFAPVEDADDGLVERIWSEVERRAANPVGRVPRVRRSAWRRGTRRVTALVAVASACVGLAGGAVAAVTVGGGSAPASDTTSAITYSNAIDEYAIGRTPAILPINTPAIARAAAVAGVDITNMHQGVTRYGVTPYLAPDSGGGLCAMWEHSGGSWAISCGTPDHIQDTMWFDEPDGSWRYVGFRPDGVSSVTAADGTAVPVIDNAFVSLEPIK